MPPTPAPPPSDEESPYDVFVSYAREDDKTGWVRALVDLIRLDHAGDGSPPLRVFFDTDDIQGMNPWRQRIEAALRRSRVLLVCLSPSYRASDYCRWEWLHFHSARSARRARHPETAAVVRFVTVPGTPAGMQRSWIDEVREVNYLLDLKEWFADRDGRIASPQVWAERHGQEQARRIFDRLWQNVSSERAAQRAEGNLRGGNPHFVGRVEPLRALHRLLTAGQVGTICSVQGLGGIGKTELALQYAYEHAWNYSAGLWQVSAAGQTQLLPLLAQLAQDSGFLEMHGTPGQPLRFTPEEEARADKRGRRVLQAMLARAQRLRDDERAALAGGGYTMEPQGGGAVLVILDNVDDPALLSQRELVQLPELNQARDRIRFLATSRLGRDALTAPGLRIVELGRLSADESMALMRSHRRLASGGADFPDAGYAAAVEELVRLLDGYTLAVEQVAVYLALNDEVSPQALVRTFRSQGLTASDTLLTDDARVGDQILHPDRLIAIVLDQTLRTLDALPLARKALEVAAWLPPDHVPWAWLEALVRAEEPAAFEVPEHKPQPWAQAQRRLRAAQLLTEGSDGVARLHRVVGDHLRRRLVETDPQRASDIDGRVKRYASELARRTEREFRSSKNRPWHVIYELRALADFWRQLERATVESGSVAGVIASLEFEFGRIGVAFELASYSRKVFEKLSGDNANDIELLNSAAASDCILADILVRRAALGDLESAYSCLDRSLARYRLLLTDYPLDRDFRRNLAGVHHRLAESLFYGDYNGDTKAAFEHLQYALTIIEKLATDEPNDYDALRNLGALLGRSAHLLLRWAAQEFAELALSQRRKSLEIHEKLAANHADDPQAQRDLAIILNESADYRLLRGGSDIEPAYIQKLRGMAILERLAAESPESYQAQHDLSSSIATYAGFLWRRASPGHTEAVYMSLKRCIGIDVKLAEKNPEDNQARSDLSLSLRRLFDCQLGGATVADTQEDFDNLQRCLSVFERFTTLNPDDNDLKVDLGLAHLLSANWAEKANEADLCIGHLRRALEIFRHQFERESREGEPSTFCAEAVAIVAYRLGAQYIASNNPQDKAEGVGPLRIALGVIQSLEQSGKLSPTLRPMYDSFKLYENIGEPKS